MRSLALLGSFFTLSTPMRAIWEASQDVSAGLRGFVERPRKGGAGARRRRRPRPLLYALDYNEQFGYLVIFKTSEEDVHFSLPEQKGKVPCFVHNGKAIFFLTVDLYPHPSASKRDVLTSVQISADDLVRWTTGDEASDSQPMEDA